MNLENAVRVNEDKPSNEQGKLESISWRVEHLEFIR